MTANLEALQSVQQAYQRLTDADLTTGLGDTRGLNNTGMSLLADLLTVAIFQTGTGKSRPEQVASSTFRASLAALGDLYAFLADKPGDPAATMRLLTEAIREARK